MTQRSFPIANRTTDASKSVSLFVGDIKQLVRLLDIKSELIANGIRGETIKAMLTGLKNALVDEGLVIDRDGYMLDTVAECPHFEFAIRQMQLEKQRLKQIMITIVERLDWQLPTRSQLQSWLDRYDRQLQQDRELSQEVWYVELGVGD